MKLQSEKYTSGEKALTRSEYDQLVSVIDDPEDEIMIKLAVCTGLRREDLCNVKIRDLNIKDRRLTFYEAKKRRQREIDLSENMVVLIKKFYNGLGKDDMKKRDYLFSFSGRTAYNHLQKWCLAAGIPTRPFHALRATCIKFAHAQGWSDEQISKLTGDKISTIQEHYMTPSIDEMREVTQGKAIL